MKTGFSAPRTCETSRLCRISGSILGCGARGIIIEEVALLSCALCEKRKEKRFCPAVHGRICPQCCGEQREVALDCPSDCIYLLQAREHEKPRPLQDLDQGALFLEVEIGEQFVYQHEHLIMGLSY